MPRLSRPRRGFTLIELLVVIAIIAVLVGLLLPAIQKVREAAARARCQNNLKQLGAAIHNYHSATGKLPAAREVLIVSGVNKVHSWTPRILPYIEQGEVYNRYNFNLDWDEGANQNATGPIRTKIATFLCPAAPQDDRHATRGVSDYAATTERTWPNAYVSAAQSPFVSTADPFYIGMLPHDKVVSGVEEKSLRTLTHVIDGTSNTMMLAECAGRNKRFVMGREDPAQTWDAGPWANPNSRINIGGFDPATFTYGTAIPDPDVTTGPCTINCINSKEIYAFHPQVANLCMGDGAVRTVRSSVKLDTLMQLLTRNRGDIVTGLD